MKAATMIKWIGIAPSKFYDWQRRYGKVNEHNAWIPRDFWLTDWEKQAIIDYYLAHPLEGYRRLTYRMMDADSVAVSASSVYRVLKEAQLLDRWNRKASKKGTGFHQPLKRMNIGTWTFPISISAAPLLYVQRIGWFQPFYCTLGDSRTNDGNGC